MATRCQAVLRPYAELVDVEAVIAGTRPEISPWTCIVPSVCVKVTCPCTLLALVGKRIVTALLIGAGLV